MLSDNYVKEFFRPFQVLLTFVVVVQITSSSRRKTVTKNLA